MTIYLIASILTLGASIFLFFEHIIISSTSIVPLALIGISCFQAFIFNSFSHEARDHTNDTNYSVHEIDYTASRLSMKYHALTKLAVIPLLLVFTIYFDTAWKIVIPFCLYFLSFLSVRILVKYGKKAKQ